MFSISWVIKSYGWSTFYLPTLPPVYWVSLSKKRIKYSRKDIKYKRGKKDFVFIFLCRDNHTFCLLPQQTPPADNLFHQPVWHYHNFHRAARYWLAADHNLVRMCANWAQSLHSYYGTGTYWSGNPSDKVCPLAGICISVQVTYQLNYSIHKKYSSALIFVLFASWSG